MEINTKSQNSQGDKMADQTAENNSIIARAEANAKMDGKIIEEKSKKTVSLTVDQLKRLVNEKELGETLINVVENSEGNLKGRMAFGIAEAMIKQTRLKLEIKKSEVIK